MKNQRKARTGRNHFHRSIALGLIACLLLAVHAVAEEREILSSGEFRKRVIDAGGSVDFVFGDRRDFAQCHASTLAETSKGTLICAWFGGTREKDPDVGVWMSILESGKWSTPISAAKVSKTAHWNPVLFRDAEDRIHQFFKVGVDEIRWRTYRMQSQDHGVTWSSPVELVKGDVGGRGPVKNKPILLSDGAWLAPASVEYTEDGRETWKAFADRSEDQGKTWSRSDYFRIPSPQNRKSGDRFKGEGAIQPAFWESKPGHAHALLRTGSGFVWRTDSTDGGRTWSPYQSTDFPNNNSGFDVLRLPDGRVALVYNPVSENWGARTPLDLAVSSDNGRTWSRIAHLEDDSDPESEFSYPAIVKSARGLSICYTWNRERIRCWTIPLHLLN